MQLQQAALQTPDLRLTPPVDIDARLEAELLVCHVLGISRATLYAWPDRPLDATHDVELCQLLDRRVEGVPLAHLTGYREFWSLRFAVNAEALVPRPDTETLVEAALSIIAKGGIETMADVGTGTGAIAIAIAHTLQTSGTPVGGSRALQIVASDVSEDALCLARTNCEALLPVTSAHARVHLVQADWLAAYPDGSLDLIVANPPYLERTDPHLASLSHEPREALVSGPDGLDAIRHIIHEVPRVARSGARVLLEHGYTQAAAVAQCFVEHGFVDIETRKDLAGHDRITSARCTESTRSRYPAPTGATPQALPRADR